MKPEVVHARNRSAWRTCTVMLLLSSMLLGSVLAGCANTLVLPAPEEPFSPDEPPIPAEPPVPGEPPAPGGPPSPGEPPAPSEPPPKVLNLELQPVLTVGLQQPLGLEVAGDGSGRLFIVQKGGLIRIFQHGTLLSDPFLDVSSLVGTDGERGLLGLAFHPEFSRNGKLYVHYSSARNGSGIIAEYSVSADANRVEAGSARIVLSVGRDPSSTYHNGGQISFGPDGYLYIALGDGAVAGNGQQVDTLLGKLLRIDVDSTPVNGSGYVIPADNPFVNKLGVRPEIWALGLRNPWRFSFDRGTGDLWIADVGENEWEEVNFQPAGNGGGVNYGWEIMEGRHCHPAAATCNQSGFTLPRIAYPHKQEANHCSGSITGGFVYRGSQIPQLQGHYVFGDFCQHTIWTAEVTTAPQLQLKLAIGTGHQAFTSFGEDEAGELYMVSYDGTLQRLVNR